MCNSVPFFHSSFLLLLSSRSRPLDEPTVLLASTGAARLLVCLRLSSKQLPSAALLYSGQTATERRNLPCFAADHIPESEPDVTLVHAQPPHTAGPDERPFTPSRAPSRSTHPPSGLHWSPWGTHHSSHAKSRWRSRGWSCADARPLRWDDKARLSARLSARVRTGHGCGLQQAALHSDYVQRLHGEHALFSVPLIVTTEQKDPVRPEKDRKEKNRKRTVLPTRKGFKCVNDESGRKKMQRTAQLLWRSVGRSEVQFLPPQPGH